MVLMTARFGEPRRGPNWFRPEPFYAWDVRDWKAGETRTLPGTPTATFPGPITALPPGSYRVQMVLDRNLGGRDFSNAPGNGYSKVANLKVEAGKPWTLDVVIDQVVLETPLKDLERVKLFEMPSPRLTAFHGRPISMRGGVILPAAWSTEPERKFPVVYEITGFGGNHRSAWGMSLGNPSLVDGEQTIRVVLDADCPTGHHVFADSANNGPVGAALVEEFIPALEAKFRGLGRPGSRLVTGHSSGGWSSLWLQVAYPDTFGGCWSTAPDPVDFRDFQRINIYRPGEKMFEDADGKPRPIARRGATPMLWYRGFSDMEEVMGRGGQLASFEAVFSPRGPDGKPAKLWDRRTGAIDLAVAKSWERYDISLILERNRAALAPKLKGKLHVYMGDLDTFYLEGATRLLGERIRDLGYDAKVELFPGKDHGSLMTQDMRTRIAREMAATIRRDRGT
jgi:S-formylglutathione hydrolase FrmB